MVPAEADRWRSAAATAGTNLSAWLRGIADLAAAQGVDVTQIRAELVALRSDLNRGVGNNLNQIAMALHVGPGAARDRSARYETALVDAVDEIARIREHLEAALGGLGAKTGHRRHPAQAAVPVTPPAEQFHPTPEENFGDARVNPALMPADIAAMLNILDA